MTIKLYGTARSRAARNLWLLIELGVPYEHVDVVQAYNKTKPEQILCRDEAFLRVNPNGHIPALDDDGLVLWESFAINLHLARKYGAPLGPADAVEDSLMTMWSFWAANEFEPQSIEILYNRVSKAPQDRDAARADQAVEALRAPMAVLDAHLATHGGYLVGGRFTVADIAVAMVVNYARPAPELFDGTPHVSEWLKRLTERPAYGAMMKMREV